MADLFKRITDSRNLIEKIVAYIPGFKGYVDRNARRDADKLLRETVATRFEQQWSRLSGIQRDLVGQGSIEIVDDVEAAVVKLRTLADRVRTASYGYAGFFDAIKVNEPPPSTLCRRFARSIGARFERSTPWTTRPFNPMPAPRTSTFRCR